MKNKLETCLRFVFFAISICFLFPSSATSQVKVHSTTDFMKVDEAINGLIEQYGTSEVLLVLDIDNTLLTSSVDLGGDVWYQWQRGELDIKPTEDQKVDCLFEDAIGLLYELNPMKLTDHRIAKLIKNWQEQGLTLFALTSRHPKYRAATERELVRNGLDLTKTALKPFGLELPVMRVKLDREMSYMKGIMMTTGMNKGVMLKYLLSETGRSFKAIVFVDDSEKNISNLNTTFSDCDVDMNIFHYKKIIEDRKLANGGVILTKDQAEQMSTDWKELNHLLIKLFPDRNLRSGCLGSQ